MTLERFGRIVRQRIRSLFARSAIDAEVSRELAFHFEALVSEHVAGGMPQDAARRAARLALGNVPALEDECRDQRGVGWLHDLRQDLVHGARILRRTPGLTAIAAASLALGIGANAATLGVAEALVLGQLPFQDANRLALVRTFDLDNPIQKNNASLAEYAAIKDSSRAFASIGVSIADQSDFGADTGGVPNERLAGQLCDPALFETLGVQPLLGRVFTGDAPSGVVISYGLWQRRWAGDPDILNRTVRLNGVATPIVAVMPSGFSYPIERVQYWLPLRVTRRSTLASPRYYTITARLGAGVTRLQADDDLQRVAAMLAASNDVAKGRGLRIEPLREAWYGWTVAPLATFQAAVLLILIISCTNVAGLLLARSTTRAPELALRVALGAGRGRIVRQLLAESVLLSLLGGVLGIVVTWWGLRALAWMAPLPGAVRIPQLAFGLRMLMPVAAVAFVAGLLFGVVPAFLSSRGDLAPAFKEAHRGAVTPRRGFRLRNALVSGQVAVALVLLIGTGLLVNSFLRLNARDINLDPHGVLTFGYRIPASSYLRSIGLYNGFPYYDVSPAPSLTIERVYERLQHLPGVEAVAGISHLPAGSLLVPRAHLQGSQQKPSPQGLANENQGIIYFFVTPNVFSVLRTPIVRGREFDARDTASSTWGVVVNETLARQLWPGEDPLGKEFRLDTIPEDRPRQVIGVVRDIPLSRSRVDSDPIAYFFYLQQAPRTRGPAANAGGQMTFLIRGSGVPSTTFAAARRAVAEIDPDRPIADLFPMDLLLDQSLTARQAMVFAIGAFALAATVLAAVGIYGVMAYTVAQREREIGIRIALGAGASHVVSLIARNALLLISIGLTAGLACAYALTRLIASQLWGVTPTDPVTFITVSLLLSLVALLACTLPLRHALRVDPTAVLKRG